VTVDANGDMVGYEDYYLFGEQITVCSANKVNSDDVSKLTGEELYEATGLSYFGARYYDVEIGRWLSVDPLAGKYPSLSPYIYCLNNPLNRFDPDGERPWRAKEREIVLSTLKQAEIRYFTELGKDFGLKDKDYPITEGWRYFEPGIEVKGLRRYENMRGAEFLEVTALIVKEYAKSIHFGDPRANTITGKDSETGGKVEFNIGKDKLENTIRHLEISWKKGAKIVSLRYMGYNKFGSKIEIATKKMTVEQYNDWLKKMKKIQNEERKKIRESEEEENKNNY